MTAVLTLVGAAPGMASAAAIQSQGPVSFSTSWTIGGTGITGPNVVSIAGITGGTLYDPESQVGEYPGIPAGPPGMFNFRWGELRASDVPAGTVSRYNNTPFTFRLTAEGAAPVELKGVLNGVVGDPSHPNFEIKFDTSKLMEIDPLFPADGQASKGRGLILMTGGSPSILVVPSGPIKIDPSSADRGNAAIRGTVFPVPEPASVAVFAIVATGIGLMHRRRGTRRRGRAC